MITKDEILNCLKEVKDPEIPMLSIVDLGIVTDINITNHDKVKIKITPTFAGCPALKFMQEEIKQKISQLNISSIEVEVNYDVSWNSNMISKEGKEILKKSGLAPPIKHDGFISINLLKKIECPYCGSKETILKSTFGSTLCRAISYCSNCHQTFEQFKPV